MTISVQNEGSIYIVYAKDSDAEDWLYENLKPEMCWMKGIVVEHRYIGDILNGFIEAGGTIV